MKFMMKINDGRVGTLLCPRGYQTAWADDKPVCPRYSLSTNLPWALYIIASIGWALLFLTGATQQWHAVVLLTIHGIAGVLWMLASQLLIHDIVGGKNL